MIYSTLCVGKVWCEKYSQSINNFGKNYNLYVLTDLPEYFPNCNVIKYEREVFSYYEKLPFILKLIIQYKKRVIFFDADSVNNPYLQVILNKEYKLDNSSVYSLNVYNTKAWDRKKVLENPSFVELMEIYRSYSYELLPDYIHERIFSLPYKSNQTHEILNQVLEMQEIFETKYYKGRIWPQGHQNQRWSKAGCGYAEGGALSIIIHNMKIPTKPILLKENII